MSRPRKPSVYHEITKDEIAHFLLDATPEPLVPTLCVGTGLLPLCGVGQHVEDDVRRISDHAYGPFRPRRRASKAAFPRGAWEQGENKRLIS